MRLGHFVAATAMLAASLAAHADTFQYTVEFNDTSFISTATFTVPSLITTPTTVTDVTGTSNQGDLQSVEADPTVGSCTASGASTYACFITHTQYGTDDLYFTSDVDTVGVFTDIFGDGTVTITDIPGGSSVTPEPSSFALLGTGLLGVAGVLRKRFA